jgi:hypothetical protein
VIGIGGVEVLLFGLLAALILLLAYRMSRAQETTPADLAFMVLVIIGALVAPPIATVILLAMIYQQLVVIARKS